MKPFKGYISDWCRVYVGDKFCIFGRPHGHPNFTNWIRTSKVVSMYEIPQSGSEGSLKDRERRFEIETLNSRYELIGLESSPHRP